MLWCDWVCLVRVGTGCAAALGGGGASFPASLWRADCEHAASLADCERAARCGRRGVRCVSWYMWGYEGLCGAAAVRVTARFACVFVHVTCCLALTLVPVWSPVACTR